MIVPAMTAEEIVKEILLDYKIVLRKAMYLTESLRRNAIKSKNKHFSQMFEYKSSQKNQWLIDSDYHMAVPTFKVVIYYLNSYGFNAIMVDGSGKAFIHYSSHFLERFNERFLKQMNLSKLDLLKRFISANSISYN